PPLERRWQALAEAKAVGIKVGVCVTPTLPIRDIEGFVKRLVEFAPDVLVTQYFHGRASGFGADTGEAARAVLEEHPWSEEDYQRTVAKLREHLEVYEGEEGFFPPA